MKHFFYSTFVCLLTISATGQSQTKKELALSKAREAAKIMDNGQLDESIELLKECEKLDSKNSIYPYEIAYAYTLKKEYTAAIDILDKVKKYKDVTSQTYQMSGNCYSYLGNSEKALQEYESGLKKFPNAGNLHLEKGNIYYQQEKYDEAAVHYKRGIDADPMFASNYYNLSGIYLKTSDKLSGIIYGEIFLNLERTTKRSLEMSKVLYNAYKNAVEINGSDAKIEFCEIVFDASQFSESKLPEMPLCGIFGKNFILATMGHDKVDYNSISEMRMQFVRNFFEEDYKKYSNVLFEYQKLLLDNHVFDAYNRYIFQMGAKDEFGDWEKSHNKEFEAFKTWYTNPDNYLKVTKSNRFVAD